jgi:serine/threonine protein kinase
MSIAISEFWSQLVQSGLSDAEGCKRIATAYAKQHGGAAPEDADSLARFLARSGVITSFQRRALLSKSGEQLKSGRFVIRGDEPIPPFHYWLPVQTAITPETPRTSRGFLLRVPLNQLDAGRRGWLALHSEIRADSLQPVQLSGGAQTADADHPVEIFSPLPSGRVLCELGEAHSNSFTPNETVRLGIDLAQALDAMHQHSHGNSPVCHGAVGADHVWLTPKGDAILLRDPSSPARNPNADMSFCWIERIEPPARYAAPELADAHVVPTPASDVYSLGCLLHSLLLGRSSRSGKTNADLFAAHRSGLPAELATAASQGNAGDPLLRVLAYAMAPDPAARFASAAGFAEALKRVGELLGEQNPASKQSSTSTKPAVSEMLPDVGPNPQAGAKPAPPVINTDLESTKSRPGSRSRSAGGKKSKKQKSKPANPPASTDKPPQSPTTADEGQPKSAAEAASNAERTAETAASPAARVRPQKQPPEKQPPARQLPAEQPPRAPSDKHAAGPSDKRSTGPTDKRAAGAEPVADAGPTRGKEENASPTRRRRKRKKNRIPILIGMMALPLLLLILAIFLRGRGPDPKPRPRPRPSLSERVPEVRPSRKAADSDTRPASKQSDGYELVDSDRLLWVPPYPADSSPPSLRLLPPGPAGIVSVPISKLVSSDGWESVRTAFAAELDPLIAEASSRAGVPADAINRCTAALFPGRDGWPELALAIELNQPTPAKDLIDSWGAFEARTAGGATIYAGEDPEGDAFFIGDSEDGKPKGTDVTRFAVASVERIREIADNKGGPIPLVRAMQTLWDHASEESDIVALMTPNFLFADGRQIVQSSIPEFQDTLKRWMIPDVGAVMVTATARDSDLYVELREFPSGTATSTTLLKSLRESIAGWPKWADDFIIRSVPDPSWRLLATRLPMMFRFVGEHTRTSVDGETVIASAYLPANAASQVALGAVLAMNTPAGQSTGSVATAPRKPLTVEEMLNREMSISFLQLSLQFAINAVVEEFSQELPEGSTMPKVRIIGGDLELNGITQNQQIRGFERDDVPLRDVLTEIVLGANPDKTATGPKDEKQALIWVVHPPGKPASETEILITTREAAAKKGYELPKEFQLES